MTHSLGKGDLAHAISRSTESCHANYPFVKVSIGIIEDSGVEVESSVSQVKWSESHSVVSNSLRPHGLNSPWNFPGQNTRVGSLFLLQGIFPAQRSNPALLHCRWILYQLSYKGSPRILQWVACSFSSGSSQPRNRTRVTCIDGRFFTNWAIREALSLTRLNNFS